MRNRLLMTTAAIALIAGTGFATAQDKKEGAAPAPAAQQSAPAEKMAPPATQKAPDAKPSNAQNAKPDVKADTKSSAQAPTAATDKKVEGKSEMKASETKPDAKAPDNKSADSNKSPATQNSAQTKPADAAKPGATTGQGAAGARSANLSTEQKTTIKTVIREQKVAPVTNVNFSISIGTRIPREVRHYPLPARVIEVYPSWRGYEYILVRDEILVIDPRTLEIVAVIEA